VITKETDTHVQSIDINRLNPEIKSSGKLLGIIFTIINHTHFQGKICSCRAKWSDRVGNNKHCRKVSDFTVFEDKQFIPVIRLSRSLLADKDIIEISKALFQGMVQVWLWMNGRPWGYTSEFLALLDDFDFELIGEHWRKVIELQTQFDES